MNRLVCIRVTDDRIKSQPSKSRESLAKTRQINSPIYDNLIVYIMNKRRDLFPFFFSVALKPKSGPGHLIVEVYRTHIMRHSHTHTPGRTPLVAGVTTYAAQNNFKRRTLLLLAGFEPAIHQSSGRRPTLQDTHGHQDRKQMLYAKVVLKSFIIYD
jgi:hypothetical protein